MTDQTAPAAPDDDLSEQAFYMVGTIDEAMMKARGEDPVAARRAARETAGAAA